MLAPAARYWQAGGLRYGQAGACKGARVCKNRKRFFAVTKGVEMEGGREERRLGLGEGVD